MKYSGVTILAALVACLGVLPTINGFSVVSTTRIQQQQQHTLYGSPAQSLEFYRSAATFLCSSASSSEDTDDVLPKQQQQNDDETSSPDALEQPSFSSQQLSTQDNNSSSTSSSNSLRKKKQQQQSWGVTKTILLTVPLFFKFLVVLVIKFMTDLVVFPLLFSYRMCRRAKRKVLGWFPKKKEDLPNGETRP